jgi:GT2 family glycosyltransferase
MSAPAAQTCYPEDPFRVNLAGVAMNPNDQPLISVVIPNYNGAAYLRACLSSLVRQTYPGFELLVVDNASNDSSIETAFQVAPSAIILRQDMNLGFAGGANAGIRAASGQWVAVLNNDTEVAEDWIEECVAAIRRHPDAAFLACRILDARNRSHVYSAGDCFLRAAIGYRRGQEQPDRPEFDDENETFAPCGCAALYRKSVLERSGGYDERWFAYMEDVELGLRLQAMGLRGYYAPRAKVDHHGAGTSGGEFSPLSVRLRTRNSLLLLLKSLPATILWRCAPMIFLSQVFWLARVIRHGRVLSYLRGLAGAFQMAPPILRSRRELRRQWDPGTTQRLWRAILRSEGVARADCRSTVSPCPSLFLKVYFFLFRSVVPEQTASVPEIR